MDFAWQITYRCHYEAYKFKLNPIFNPILKRMFQESGKIQNFNPLTLFQ